MFCLLARVSLHIWHQACCWQRGVGLTLMFPGDVYWRQHFLPGVGAGPVFHKHMTSDTLNKNSVLLARKKAGEEGNVCGIGNQQCFSHHPHLFWREEGAGGYGRTQKETMSWWRRDWKLQLCGLSAPPLTVLFQCHWFYSPNTSRAQENARHLEKMAFMTLLVLFLFGGVFLDNPFVLQTWVKGHKIRPWSKEGEKI